MSGRALGGAAGPSLTVAQVIAVADATRRRIERDLHDGLQQQLVSLALRVRAAEAMALDGETDYRSRAPAVMSTKLPIQLVLMPGLRWSLETTYHPEHGIALVVAVSDGERRPSVLPGKRSTHPPPGAVRGTPRGAA